MTNFSRHTIDKIIADIKLLRTSTRIQYNQVNDNQLLKHFIAILQYYNITYYNTPYIILYFNCNLTFLSP